jgi:signal transduction histidine kinase
MAQEAIRNVVKHAEADHVVVSVGPEAGGVSLKIADDGRGLQPDAESPVEHFGLAGIRERAAMLGGSARIEGIPAKGTTVEIWVPD